MLSFKNLVFLLYFQKIEPIKHRIEVTFIANPNFAPSNVFLQPKQGEAFQCIGGCGGTLATENSFSSLEIGKA